MIAYCISLLWGEIFENWCFVHIWFGDFIVVFHHVSLNFKKNMLTETPKCWLLQCLYRGRTRGRVYYCQFSKKLPFLHVLYCSAIDFYLYLALLYDEKHACGMTLLKDIFSFISLISLHSICKLSPLMLGEFE